MGAVDELMEVAHFLEPALEGSHDLSDLEEELENGTAQLWNLGDAAVVTQVSEWPRMRVLRVWLAGGSLEALRAAIPALDLLAVQFDCQRIEVDGRKGWGRVLDGFTETRRTYAKEVNDGRTREPDGYARR